MSKATYLQRFEKTSKFYDNAYHHHKATFKGLAEFYNNYCSIQKEYANQLLKLGQGINDFITDFTSELPYIQQGIREVCGQMERTSQLHFNFAERLREIGEACKEEYAVSKRGKEKFMKLNFEKTQEEHQKARQSKNRNILNEKEKDICRRLHAAIDVFMEDQANRTQKLKEQLVIYFSLAKKIAEKELELTGSYAVKMAQYEIHVKVPQIGEVEDALVQQFNSYGEEKIYRKAREINQQIAVHRESLRESIFKKEKQVKLQDYQSKMQQLVDKYKEIPQELNYPDDPDPYLGLFDTRSIPNYRQYAREFKGENIKELAFTWLACFYVGGDDEQRSLLTVVKTNMKMKTVTGEKFKDTQEFLEMFAKKSEENRWTVYLLLEISRFYQGKMSLTELGQVFRNRKSFQLRKGELHWKVQVVLVDALLDSVIIIRQGYSLLYQEYIDILRMVTAFASNSFQFDSILPLLLLLRKFQRVLAITNSAEEQIIEEVYLQKLQSSNQGHPETEQLQMQVGHRIINFLTDKMSHFYACRIAFSNLVKLSLCLQKALPKNYFTALQHLNKCIRLAGFNFLADTDDEKKVLQGGIWRGEERLRNLTELLEQLEYERISEDFFQPIARSLAKLVGVGYEVILAKMVKEFLLPTWEIVGCNLSILAQQEGTDREGYVLRLGLCLAELDLSQSQELSAYDAYFRVLEVYLQATEKEYDQLLEQSRMTELWIVEENSQATQNCIDFCSLLYKPFEFLLTSLKKLEERPRQTEFTRKYNQFIKLKLNCSLQAQIQKYVKFLLDSLSVYPSKEPQLTLKPKFQELLGAVNEQVSKGRYSFREMTRRLFNLIFLKQQLQEIVCDFVEKEVYQQLDSSIFHLDLLKQVAAKPSPRQDLLTNISQLVTLILNAETQLIRLMASASVFHFLRRLFSNLYFQEQRGFFSADARLSQHTFQKYQKELQELLMAIARNFPPQALDGYSRLFCAFFFRAYRLQLLNPHKFKVGLQAETVLNYLKSDLAFACSLLKKKCLDAAFVRDGIEEPAKGLFRDLQQGSQKLMQRFSDATLKHNDEEAKYLLAVLNLRSEEKVQDFVQKYKKVVK